MYGDFPAKNAVYTPYTVYTYKCMVLANPTYVAGGCAGKPCAQECLLEPTSRRWCKFGVGGEGGGRWYDGGWVRWKALHARVSAGAHKQTLVQVWCGRRGRWYQGLQLHTALTMQNNLELGNVCFCQSLIQSQSLLLVTSDYGAYDAE